MLNFKKITAVILSVIAMGLHCRCPAVYAQSEESAFTHTLINGEVTIIGFSGDPVYLEIPEYIDGYPVTKIRDNAFFNCSSLKQISLPDTITEIGHHTFYGCNSLESIVLPDLLTELGMGAFTNCTSLSAVTLPLTLEALPEACFDNCSALAEIVIPQGISSIGDYCFTDCTALSYVSIGADASHIGKYAFFNCSSLTSIYIPPSVTTIGDMAVGFSDENSSVSAVNDFTVMGIEDSQAEIYAQSNNLPFLHASEAISLAKHSSTPVKRIPLWIIPLLAGSGLGLFALSCIIAVRQVRRDRKSSHENNEKD